MTVEQTEKVPEMGTSMGEGDEPFWVCSDRPGLTF